MCNFAPEIKTLNTMDAVREYRTVDPIVWSEEPLIDPDFKSKPMLSTEQFFDKLCQKVGAYYGMDDIRKAC